MSEYVKKEDVLQVIQNGLGKTNTKIAQEMQELPTVNAKTETDLVTVLGFESGERAAVRAIREQLEDLKNHQVGNRYNYDEITKIIDNILKKLDKGMI